MTEDIKREEFVKNLILDKGNPRLVEFGISSKSTEQEIMRFCITKWLLQN